MTALTLPLEDILIGSRTVLLRQPAPQDIVVVAIDETTLKAVEELDVPRSADAKLIENLFDNGVERIFFDRSYHFKEQPEEDRVLAETLAKYDKRVAMGANPATDDALDEANLAPADSFRDHVEIVSLVSLTHPFNLSLSFPYTVKANGRRIPSMAASLANLEEYPDGFLRPDYSYDVKSIPTYSYVDVLEGKVPSSQLAGRDVVIALAAVEFHDYHHMPAQGWVPGAYFHVIAAHTLKRGVPWRLGWLPAMLLVSIVIATGIGRGHSFNRYHMVALGTVVGAAPLVLDSYNIQVDVMPAVVAAGIAVFRARTLEKVEEASEFNISSGLPSLQTLRLSSRAGEDNLIALKVRNYRAITGSFAKSAEAKLASEIVRRIRIGDPNAIVHHEGDMFVWASCVKNPVDLFEHLEGLHRIVQNGLLIDDREVDLTFNCGIEADVERPMEDRVAAALQAAEQAMRNDELVCIHESTQADIQWEISLLSSLDHAIDNGEVWVAFQPKQDMRSGKICSAEALARWTHPERGSITPEQFIGIAEEYHRIERITRFVLNESVRVAASILRHQPDFEISVNISAQLLRDEALPEMISDVLKAHRYPADHLVLEITETDRLDKGSATFAMIQRLVESGLQLSIDDFGTGNATIDYLRYLPAREIKIDKVFVQGMETNREDLLLVQSIIEMAHGLERRVVAEGVENKEILELLRSMDCDVAQGYFVGQPSRAEVLLRMLEPNAVKAHS